MKEKRRHADHEESEETRRTILRVAQQLFMEYGYRAVSTRQLADACGLTQPALYHYFSDKQDLYLAMAKEEIAKARSALERIGRRSEGVTERLRSVALYLINTTRYDHGLMLHDIRYELAPEARTTLNQLFQAGFIAPIAAIFEDGQRQGLLRPPQQGGIEPATAVYLFMSMVSNFLMRSRDTHSMPEGAHPDSDAETSALIVHVLFYGLARPLSQETETNGEAR